MTNSKYAFQIGNQIRFIHKSQIMYCLSDGNYTTIIVSGGKKVITSKSLKALEDLFSSPLFVRIHHSLLVNIAFIESFSKENNYAITMSDGKMLQVSRRKKKGFLMQFQKL